MRITLMYLVGSMMLLAGCSAGGVNFRPDDTPRDQWTALETRYLTNVRQLTAPNMGLDKSGEAYFSPDQRKIIFQANPRGEGEYQMYILGLDESGHALPATLKRISRPGGACTCGNFHPDGRRVIFGSTYLQPGNGAEEMYRRAGSTYSWPKQPGMDVFETDLDGGNIRRLTDAPGYDAECAFSPDGKQIVFTSCRDDGDPELYVMDADGKNQRRLTRARGYDGGPFFSPDGKRVVFRGDRQGNSLLQLFVINADGTSERRLTHTSFVNWGPYWHPNGHTLAFATSAHGHENYEVYLMNIDTGRTLRLTWKMGFDGLPVFSPDGKRMMWTSKRGPDATSQIFLADFKLPDGF